MRKIFSLISILALIIYSCKSIDPDSKIIDPLQIQANLLDGTWKLKDISSAIKDGNVEETFSSIELILFGSTKIGGNFSTVNTASEDVWPIVGSWEFYNDDQNQLMRNDSVLMSISITDSTLITSFTVSGGLKEGNWVFNFIK